MGFGAEFNAGFVQGLWYSADEIFAEQPVRVYVALRNNTEHDLTGTVTFTDNGSRIGSSQISALPGRLVEAWADWTPTRGEHELRATLSNIQIHEIGGTTTRIEVESDLAEDVLIVDIDTDKDGVGNSEDADDDNDMISDEDEITAGTDPLTYTKKLEPEKKTEETEGEENTDTTDDTTTGTASSGLERFFDDSTRIDSFLSGFTEKIEETKTSLDTYRTERNLERSRDTRETGTSTIDNSDSTQKLDVTGTLEGVLSPAEEFATITRSRIDTKPGIVTQLFGAIEAFFSGIYTFTLFGISKILEHPAVVELIFLLLVVLIIFRIARRFGRRPID